MASYSCELSETTEERSMMRKSKPTK